MASVQKSFANYMVRFFTSLQLTIVCLALGMVLILVGTLAQRHMSTDQAVNLYFRTWFVMWSPPGASWSIPIAPGGFLVGFVLLINLLAAHLYRFQFSWRKLGILAVHAGIITLLLGELFTALFARESMMRIEEGETKSYSEAFDENELAIIDRTDPETDKVLSIAQPALKPGATVQQPEMPFRLEVRAFYPNSRIFRRGPESGVTGEAVATTGMGTGFTAQPIPPVSTNEEVNIATAWVELFGLEGSLGTWMVSNVFDHAQEFTHDGRSYTIELRPRRFYKPFSLSLLDFSFDRYPGTDKAKNFSSRVILRDPRRNENREVLIYMNNPLRYDGLTFFQHSFESGETTTILQVVRNPSSLLPYIACVVVGLGLLFQFSVHMFGFLNRRSVKP